MVRLDRRVEEVVVGVVAGRAGPARGARVKQGNDHFASAAAPVGEDV